MSRWKLNTRYSNRRKLRINASSAPHATRNNNLYSRSSERSSVPPASVLALVKFKRLCPHPTHNHRPIHFRRKLVPCSLAVPPSPLHRWIYPIFSCGFCYCAAQPMCAAPPAAAATAVTTTAATIATAVAATTTCYYYPKIASRYHPPVPLHSCYTLAIGIRSHVNSVQYFTVALQGHVCTRYHMLVSVIFMSTRYYSAIFLSSIGTPFLPGNVNTGCCTVDFRETAVDYRT